MIRVLIAKPGLDGHDKGAKTVAVALKNAGMEVIYTGRRQRVGLSILSGTHLEMTKELMEKMKEKELGGVPVVVGGVIPKKDIGVLKTMGVKEVFPIGSTFEEIIQGVKKIVGKE